MKKRDYIAIAAIVIIIILIFVLWKAVFDDKGSNAVVVRDNVQIVLNGLSDDCYLVISGGDVVRFISEKEAEEAFEKDENATNLLFVGKGKADMVKARCKDQVCLNMKPVSNVGESIICMPNKIYVTIK